ncbi:reverse transcriptase domain-containing protein [Tanacetum coccineum]
MSFIDSPEFIAFYGVRQSQPHRLLLRYKDFFSPHQLKYISFVDDVTFPQQQQDFAPNVSDLFVKQFYVIGSSCGLWCFHGYNNLPTKRVVIWNPAIRKSVGIVWPRFINSLIGFGVRPSTYDPTIVVISDKWQVHIFTLSSKSWKMIPSSNLPRESIRLRSMTQVSIDRFIFWVAKDVASSFKNMILSFDLITHKFKEVELPVSIANNVFSLNISISELNESLVVSASTDVVNGGLVYGIWMMGEEGGVMTSFENLFTIKTPDLATMTLLGFRKNGEPIMETIDDVDGDEEFAELQVYEPRSEHIHNLGIYGEIDSLFICPYKESLLLADHSGCCIFSNDY